MALSRRSSRWQCGGLSGGLKPRCNVEQLASVLAFVLTVVGEVLGLWGACARGSESGWWTPAWERRGER